MKCIYNLLDIFTLTSLHLKLDWKVSFGFTKVISQLALKINKLE